MLLMIGFNHDSRGLPKAWPGVALLMLLYLAAGFYRWLSQEPVIDSTVILSILIELLFTLSIFSIGSTTFACGFMILSIPIDLLASVFTHIPDNFWSAWSMLALITFWYRKTLYKKDKAE